MSFFGRVKQDHKPEEDTVGIEEDLTPDQKQMHEDAKTAIPISQFGVRFDPVSRMTQQDFKKMQEDSLTNRLNEQHKEAIASLEKHCEGNAPQLIVPTSKTPSNLGGLTGDQLLAEMRKRGYQAISIAVDMRSDGSKLAVLFNRISEGSP